MTEIAAIEPSSPPARHTIPSLRPTGKVRAAIEAMVWQALPRAEAAQAAGISEHGLYKALRKPPVKAFYLAELEVLRTSERARNIHRAIAIRDAAENMPAMHAIRYLDQVPDGVAQSGAMPRSPGVVIVVNGNATVAAHDQQSRADQAQVLDLTEDAHNG